jgi:hypothetical protein
MKVRRILLTSIAVSTLLLCTGVQEESLAKQEESLANNNLVANRFTDWWVDCWYGYCADPFS